MTDTVEFGQFTGGKITLSAGRFKHCSFTSCEIWAGEAVTFEQCNFTDATIDGPFARKLREAIAASSAGLPAQGVDNSSMWFSGSLGDSH